MMANFETWLTTDLQKGLAVQTLPGNLFSQDAKGNLIGVHVLDGGEPATLSGTVNGYVIRPDGQTVVVPGTLDGNDAYILLPENAYYVIGRIQVVVRLTNTDDDSIVTLGACVGTVTRSTTGSYVTSDQSLPDIEEMLAKIAIIEDLEESCRTNAAAATSAAATAAADAAADVHGLVAGTYSTSATYAVGDYVFYNGNLYRCTTAITTAEAWTAAHWTQVPLANDVANNTGEIADVKSALLSYTSITSKTGELATGSISASGKINAGTTDETLYFYLVDGLTSVVVSEGSLYGFFANAPAISSIAVDSTRHIVDLYNTEISIINGARYLAVRSSADKTPTVYGIGSIQQNVSALNDEVEYINIGKEPITGTWVAGEANTSGGVSQKRNRIAINAIVSYNRPITIYVDNGYMFFLRYYSNNEFVSNSEWVTDSIYVPAGQQFMITVQKYPENLSDYATLSYGENIHVSTTINQRLIALETVTGNPWIGKKWIGFGTSLTDTTQPMSGGEVGEVTGKYPAYLQQLSGMVYVNYAVGGSTLCNMATMSKSTVIEQIDLAIQNDDIQNADLITIDGFVNDWYHQSAIGNLTDTTDSENNDSTIYMAMHTALQKITTANPKALIAFIADSTGKDTWAYDQKRNGNYQYDFINAMRTFCNFAGCLFIDAGLSSEINVFHPQYIGDHIHHTYIGGEQFANAIWSVLKAYSPMVQ